MAVDFKTIYFIKLLDKLAVKTKTGNFVHYSNARRNSSPSVHPASNIIYDDKNRLVYDVLFFGNEEAPSGCVTFSDKFRDDIKSAVCVFPYDDKWYGYIDIITTDYYRIIIKNGEWTCEPPIK